jgi:hypothetical protein
MRDFDGVTSHSGMVQYAQAWCRLYQFAMLLIGAVPLNMICDGSTTITVAQNTTSRLTSVWSIYLAIVGQRTTSVIYSTWRGNCEISASNPIRSRVHLALLTVPNADSKNN